MGLRPFRQVADTCPLGPADNQPTPCGAFLNLFDRLGRRIMGCPGTANQRHMGISGDGGVRSILRTTARYECVPVTFDAGVVSLQLMKSLAMSRAIKHMNPPAAVPHITGADT